MAVRYPLELLIDSVKAQVAEDWGNPDEPAINVVFGHKEPRKNINIGTRGRFVFTDCDADGDLGEIGPAKQWPQPADPLFTLYHVFLVYVFAYDPAAAEDEDELAQYHMGMKVLTEAIRAIYNATQKAPQDPTRTSPITFGKPKRIKPEAQIQWGREWVIRCTIEQPILDMFDDQLVYRNVAPAVADVTTTHESTIDTYTTRETP